MNSLVNGGESVCSCAFQLLPLLFGCFVRKLFCGTILATSCFLGISLFVSPLCIGLTLFWCFISLFHPYHPETIPLAVLFHLFSHNVIRSVFRLVSPLLKPSVSRKGDKFLKCFGESMKYRQNLWRDNVWQKSDEISSFFSYMCGFQDEVTNVLFFISLFLSLLKFCYFLFLLLDVSSNLCSVSRSVFQFCMLLW